jgi:two-component system nitrogen regulation sensor histidine kinase GlnL
LNHGLEKNRTIVSFRRSEKDRFVALFEALPDAVLVLDIETGAVLFSNHAAQALFGCGAKALQGKTLAELLGETNPLADAAQGRDGGLRQGVTVHDVLIRNQPCASLSAVPLEEQGLSLVVLRAGAPPVKTQWVDRARRAFKPAQHLARLLGHEIRNPLSGIRGAAQLLAASDLGDDDRELAKLIDAETQRILRLIDKVNVFDDAPLSQYGPVNLHEILTHVMRLSQPGFAGVIAPAFDPSLPCVHGHRDRLVQALLNLVKNAIEACDAAGLGPAGRVTVRTYYDAHGSFHPDSHAKLPLCVDIEDNGPGLSPEMQKGIFEPYRTTKPSGLGLGLSIVSKIVDDHGGALEAQGGPGRTVFRISLPRDRAAAGEAA